MYDFYHSLGRILVITFGPLTLISIILMYVSLYRATGKPPHLAGIVFSYVRLSLAKKGHPGILTYLLIVSGIFFTAAMLGLLILDIVSK